MSAVSEVHVHLLTSLSLKTIQNWLFRYMEEYEASYLISQTNIMNKHSNKY